MHILKQRYALVSIIFSLSCLLLLAIHLGSSSLERVLEHCQNVSPFQLAWLWALMSSAAVYLLRTLRLKLMVQKCSLSNSFYICATHNVLTRLLPFRSGEFSLPFMLNKREDIPVLEGTLLMLWLRLVEVATLVPFIAFCALLNPALIDYLPFEQAYLWTGIAGLSLCISLWIKPILKGLITVLCLIFTRLKKDKFVIKLSQVQDIGHNISQRKALLAISMTFLILFGQASLFYWILCACGSHLHYLNVALASVLVHLAGVIPAPTMGNVGTHEIAWLVIFKTLGLNESIALSSAVLSQWLTLLFAVAWWGLAKTFSYLSID